MFSPRRALQTELFHAHNLIQIDYIWGSAEFKMLKTHNYSQSRKKAEKIKTWISTCSLQRIPLTEISDVFFITGKTYLMIIWTVLVHTKPSGGEEWLLIGKFKVVRRKFRNITLHALFWKSNWNTFTTRKVGEVYEKWGGVVEIKVILH